MASQPQRVCLVVTSCHVVLCSRRTAEAGPGGAGFRAHSVTSGRSLVLPGSRLPRQSTGGGHRTHLPPGAVARISKFMGAWHPEGSAPGGAWHIWLRLGPQHRPPRGRVRSRVPTERHPAPPAGPARMRSAPLAGQACARHAMRTPSSHSQNHPSPLLTQEETETDEG